MINAVQLPPERSIYDYPLVYPGQELTPAQEEQKKLAQIAGIITAVAAGKKAVSDAVTMQVVGLLRGADLASEAGVQLFAKQAARIVRAGIKQAHILTWSGFVARTRIAGVPFNDQFPADVKESRNTSLEEAYARLAKEYDKWLKQAPKSKTVQALVEEMEAQHLTPIPRPDRISSDAVAVEEVKQGIDYDQAWREAFQKAEEETRKVTGREEPGRPATAPTVKEALRTADGVENAVRDDRPNLRIFADETEDWISSDESSATAVLDRGDDTDVVEEEEQVDVPKLVEKELERIFERYAQQKTEERAERMIHQDIQSASRNMHNAAIKRTSKKKVTGYRRVVHPELSETGQSCGLCIVASTNKYSRGDLMPIHSGCNCEVAEIYSLDDGSEFDPGQQINMADLEVFYTEAKGSTKGWDLKKSRYKVINHPEYGPTLVNANEKKASEFVDFKQGVPSE